MENSLKVGEKIQTELRRITEGLDQVAEVRGSGLFIGVDLVTDRDSLTPDGKLASGIVNRLREERVLISACGAQGNVLKIRPPLPFSMTDADRLIEAMDLVFQELR
jgi:4-aminobutyrate aminotransferase-like enzyme